MYHPIANDCEVDSSAPDNNGKSAGTDLYLMWAGNPAIQVYVWSGSFDSAFEEMVDWLDDQGTCGVFTEIGEPELRDAANSLGISWDPSWPDYSDPDYVKVQEYAEIDLTMIGHTTLKCSSGGSMYLSSYEWGGQEVTDAKEIEDVARESKRRCHGHTLLEWDIVEFDGKFYEVKDSGDLELSDAEGDSIFIEEKDYGLVERVEASNGDPDQLEKFLAKTGRADAPPPAPIRVDPAMAKHWPTTKHSSRTDIEEKKKQAKFFSQDVRRDDPFKKPGYKGGGLLGVGPPKRSRPRKFGF